jgi:short-subunit dehydrogenase
MNKEKWVLITGAFSGIGKATVEYLADNGFEVYATDMDVSDSKMFDNPNIHTFKLDVTNITDIKNGVELIEKKGTGLYGIVNNAGIYDIGPLIDFPQDKFEKLFNVNIFGSQRVTKAFFRFVLESKGRIVNFSSVSGFLSTPFSGAYVASKHAIEGWSKTLRTEVLRLGVKVTLIRPGVVDTQLLRRNKQERIEAFKDSILYGANKKIVQYQIESVNKKSIPPQKIAKYVFKALTKKRPRAKYFIPEKKFLYQIVNILPTRLTDKLLSGLFKDQIDF